VHRSPTTFETFRTERGTDLAIDQFEVAVLRGGWNGVWLIGYGAPALVPNRNGS